MLQKALQSLGLTLLVGSVLAWPFTFLDVNFFSGLAFFVTLQFIGFYFYREYIARKIALEEQQLILLREAELSKQGAEVVCPCDRQVKSFIPIMLNGRNDYVCPGCNKGVNVSVKLKTYVTTVPIVNTVEEIVATNIEKNGNS